MTDRLRPDLLHLRPVTVPAWVLSDLFMVANVSPLRAKAEEAIAAAGRALDAEKVPVRVGAQGPPSAPEEAREPEALMPRSTVSHEVRHADCEPQDCVHGEARCPASPIEVNDDACGNCGSAKQCDCDKCPSCGYYLMGRNHSKCGKASANGGGAKPAR